jgi:hypothetical protein
MEVKMIKQVKVEEIISELTQAQKCIPRNIVITSKFVAG